MIVFNARLLAAVSIAQSRDNAQYYLKGVCLEPTGVAVATNGGILTAAFDPEARIDTPGIYPIGKRLRSAALKKKAETVRIEDAAGGVASVVDGTGQRLCMEPCVPIVGDFPFWRKVLPRSVDRTVSRTVVSHILLRALTDTAAALDGAKALNRVCIFGTDGDAEAVFYGNHEDVFSIVMPMRESEKAPAWRIPAWSARPKSVTGAHQSREAAP